jgi:hypothetical protein
MPGCATCPPAVKSVLRRRVRSDLYRVRAIKEMTTAVNRLITDLTDKVTADLTALIKLVGDIPSPVIDISEIINWLTCPLLPLAILEDPRVGQAAFDALDPKLQKQLLLSMLAAYVDDLDRIYREGLAALQSYDLIRYLQKYLDELRRLDLDAESFARSVTICATVFGLGRADSGCMQEYEDGPYNEFVEEISTFSFTGLYPSGFDPNVTAIMDHMAEAEAKLKAWRLIIVTGL